MCVFAFTKIRIHAIIKEENPHAPLCVSGCDSLDDGSAGHCLPRLLPLQRGRHLRRCAECAKPAVSGYHFRHGVPVVHGAAVRRGGHVRPVRACPAGESRVPAQSGAEAACAVNLGAVRAALGDGVSQYPHGRRGGHHPEALAVPDFGAGGHRAAVVRAAAVFVFAESTGTTAFSASANAPRHG